MNTIIISIMDEAIETYGPPLFVRTEQEGKRMFVNEVNNPESRINKNPEDFHLFQIGIYNDESGEIQGIKPVKILRAIDVIKTGA